MKKNKELRSISSVLIFACLAVGLCILVCIVLLLKPGSSIKPEIPSASVPSTSITEGTVAPSVTPTSSDIAPSESKPVNSDTSSGNVIIIEGNESVPSSAVTRAIDHLLFVGDSRYNGMSIYSVPEDDFVCADGMGFEYVIANLDYIKSLCTPTTALILGMGANDCVDPMLAHEYIKVIKELMSSVPSVVLVQMVLPVNEEQEEAAGYSVITNEMIDAYNNILLNNLPEDVIILDYREYLDEEGYTMYDGLHFTPEGYEKLYPKVREFVYEICGATDKQ